ncbi:exported hypothetical protein [Candidatus Magnetomoraceae bacterium gMMP-15]
MKKIIQLSILTCFIITGMAMFNSAQAATAQFNITVTIETFGMALRDADDTGPYPGWQVSVGLGMSISMTAQDGVMVTPVNASGETLEAFTFTGGPSFPLTIVDGSFGSPGHDEFALYAKAFDHKTTDPYDISGGQWLSDNPGALTPLTIHNTGSDTFSDTPIWIYYEFHAPSNVTNSVNNEDLEVMIELRLAAP